MKRAIIDTDTLSYFFRNNPDVLSKLDKYLQEFGFINISVVTYLLRSAKWFIFQRCQKPIS